MDYSDKQKLTDGLPNLKRVHKGRLLKKNVVKAAAFYSVLHKYSIAQFFLGFVIAGSSVSISKLFPTATIIIFVFGWVVGFTTPVTLIATAKVYKKATYLAGVVSSVRRCEVIFLFDKTFDGVIFKHRIAMAKRLVSSVNLGHFELIGDCALVKKKLHLSEQSVKDLIKTDRFGLVSRLSSEQLLVMESESLIKDKKLEQAIENDVLLFYEDEELIGIHKDSCWKKPPEDTYKMYKIFTFLVPAAIALGIALIAVATVIAIVFGVMELMALYFPGFVVVFSHAYFNMKAKDILKTHGYMTGLCASVNSRTIVEIRDSCFDGLSFEQRVIIVNKLIESGNIAQKKLCFDKILVPQAFTNEQAKQALDKLVKGRVETFLSANNLKRIRIKAVTNCVHCGGVLKENRAYCTFCGKKIDTQESGL